MARHIGGKKPKTEFGRFLRNLRITRCWTQEHLCELSGIAENNLSQFETGARIPTEAMLRKLSVAFEIDHETFKAESRAPEPTKRSSIRRVKIKYHKKLMTKHPDDRVVSDLQQLQPEKFGSEVEAILAGKLKLNLRLSE